MQMLHVAWSVSVCWVHGCKKLLEETVLVMLLGHTSRNTRAVNNNVDKG